MVSACSHFISYRIWPVGAWGPLCEFVVSQNTKPKTWFWKNNFHNVFPTICDERVLQPIGCFRCLWFVCKMFMDPGVVFRIRKHKTNMTYNTRQPLPPTTLYKIAYLLNRNDKMFMDPSVVFRIIKHNTNKHDIQHTTTTTAHHTLQYSLYNHLKL